MMIGLKGDTLTREAPTPGRPSGARGGAVRGDLVGFERGEPAI